MVVALHNIVAHAVVSGNAAFMRCILFDFRITIPHMPNSNRNVDIATISISHKQTGPGSI